MHDTADVANVQALQQAAATTIVPGQREAGALTRFAASYPTLTGAADVTMDAAMTVDRAREGGGAPRERRPGHA